MKPINDPQPDLTVATTQAMPVATPSPIQMMQAMIEGGVNEKNVVAFERLAELQWRFEARDAEKAFNAAFVKLQRNMPKVQMTKPVFMKDSDKVKFTYEDHKGIMAQIGPTLLENGFSVSFSQKIEDKSVIETITLRHEGGHSTQSSFASRICQGPNGTNEMDWVQSAATRAQREVLCDILNVVKIMPPNTDARLDGDVETKITSVQAEQIEHRLAMLNYKKEVFLKYYRSDSFANIPAQSMDEIEAWLKKKENPKS